MTNRTLQKEMQKEKGMGRKEEKVRPALRKKASAALALGLLLGFASGAPSEAHAATRAASAAPGAAPHAAQAAGPAPAHSAAGPASFGPGQLVGEELVPLGAKTPVGARASSLGEAFTAVADDYSALYHNPAGLTQLFKSEVALNLRYGYVENRASLAGASPLKANLEDTRVSQLALVLTDGKNLALGLGYHSPVSFDDPLYYETGTGPYTYLARGGMDHYRLGLAFAPTKSLSLGLGLSAITGREQLEIFDSARVRYLEEYAGGNVEPSVLIHLSPFASIGASAVLWQQMRLVDTYQREGDAPVENRYTLRHPLQVKVGAAVQSGNTQVSMDWHGDYLSAYTFAPEGSSFYRRDIDRKNRHLFAVGVEQHLLPSSLILRAGAGVEATQEGTAPAGRPYRLSAGAGFEPAKRLLVDLGYHYSGGENLQNSRPGGPFDLQVREARHHVMGSLRVLF